MNYLNNEKRNRFDKLISLFTQGNISDEQQIELLELQKELKNNKAAIRLQIESIQRQINELNIGVEKLYSREEIEAAARTYSVQPPSSKAGQKQARPSDNNDVLLILPNALGKKGPPDWKYRQGRVYEKAAKTLTTPWQLKQFPPKLLKNGTSAEALQPFFTPVGATYFATETGRAELNKLLDETQTARTHIAKREAK
ncbi:MAG: hypothetical protein ABL906_07755 [Sideroxydans sp.]